MSQRIKLEDVAKLAGVSRATVSRVINRRGYLSQKTILKVEQAMESINYHPNVIARQMHSQRTNLIGIIVPTVGTPFFGELAAALEHELFKRGYKVLVGDALNDPEKEQRYLRQLLGRQVDGLIIATHNANIPEYQNANLPIVAIDRFLRSDIPVVYSDNYAGAKQACEALIQRGAKHIIHTDDLSPLNDQDTARLRAYEAVMKAHGREAITYPSLPDSVQNREGLQKIFTEHPEVDAIFTSNDLDAATLLDLAVENDYAVPKQLQIIGYDGTQTTQRLLPRLATVVQPIPEMAKKAVELLEAKLNQQAVPEEVVLPVDLKLGSTVKEF